MGAAEKLSDNVIQIRQPNEVQLREQTNAILRAAEAIQVTDVATCAQAAQYLNENKAEQKRLDAERREIVDPLNEAVKKINAKFKPLTDVLVKAEGIIKGKIGAYQTEVERKRREEQAAAEEKARKERERLQARAEAAAGKGQIEKAQELELRAATTVAAIPAHEDTKVAGASVRKVWKAEVMDVRELCRQIAEGALPPTLVEFKQAELNRVATTWQNTRDIPGLRIYQDVSVASR